MIPNEAVKLVAAHAGETILLSPGERSKLLKKIEYSIIPLLCIVYGLNYLDKTTLSYASMVGFKVSHPEPHLATLGSQGTGIQTDLNIGVSEYNWVASIFYSSFVCILSLISSNIAGWTKKTTTATMFLVVCFVGNIIRPQVFRPGDAPEYHTAITVLLVALILAFLSLIFVYFWCKRQNTAKASIRAALGYTKVEGQEFMDLTDHGKNPELSYAL